ncbi:MAG: hypothetical protein R8F63_21300 [Acidimicrobiales bacterium]|nr:hypothetical protein [Acidimicrobiales bacterium]
MTSSPALRDRATTDRGTTVVEMIVATMLLSVGILAVLVSMNTATTTTAVADNRSTGVRVASSEIEAMRAQPYDDVGISSGSRGFRRSFEGRPTVTSGGARVEARASVVVDGITYDIRRDVTWASITVGATRIPEGYKLVTITVTWDDSVGDHTIRQDTGLYRPADDG